MPNLKYYHCCHSSSPFSTAYLHVRSCQYGPFSQIMPITKIKKWPILSRVGMMDKQDIKLMLPNSRALGLTSHTIQVQM